MKVFYTFLSTLCSLFLLTSVSAQDAWPKTFTTSDGATVKIYQWQPESFADNTLKANAAISVLEKGKTDPVFGMAWLKATTATNGDRVNVQSTRINNVKLPGITNSDKLDGLTGAIESQVNNANISFALSDLQSAVNVNKQQTQLAGEISNTPPKVIYSNVPSILVLIDGTPRLQENKDWGMEAVVNTPFTIVKNGSQYYLYGGKHWYTASGATGPYSLTTSVPNNLGKVQQAVDEANKNNAAAAASNSDGSNTAANPAQESDDNTIYKVIVSTEPAELVQSNGEANFSAVDGTNLLYVANSQNDIFMDISSQQYYVLLSGRWYHSKTLSGQWEYVAADQLPADFAKIPEGSPKDNVLASVAGTDAAQDAVLDAQVPQTAKVDRSQARADVNYDGDPEFENIDGTDMAYAVNTPASVIRYRGRYYSVDNGVWFEANSAAGPWSVAVTRPDAVALIPPRYPVYYMKYVYIYDVMPDYVYMGYTPGYLNTYVYGPTIVYGTGFYYRPWYRHYYYPRPYTWGFGVTYNPWFGWGLNYGFSTGWFNVGIGFGNSYGWGGGWWGPRMYRPPYVWSPYRYNGGYYGRNAYVYNRNNYIHYNNNVYRNRVGVVTRDRPRYVAPSRPGGWNGGNRPPDRSVGIGTRPNNVRPGQQQGQVGNVRPERLPGNNNGSIGNNNGNNNSRPGRVTRPYTPGNNNNLPGRPNNSVDPGRPGTVNPGRPANPNPGTVNPNPSRPGNTFPGREPRPVQQQNPVRPNMAPNPVRPSAPPLQRMPQRQVQPQQSRPNFERGGGGGRPAESRPARSGGGEGGGRGRRG